MNASGEVLNKYVRGINLIYSEDGSGANKKYYIYNGHGDVIQLTGTDGSVIKTYDYDAFGNEVNPDPSDTNPFRYCGEYWDEETGTIYLRARYYNPGVGRFTTQDTHWNVNNMIYGDKEYKEGEARIPNTKAIIQSSNLYVYCMNNPLLYVDPTGQAVVDPRGAMLVSWYFNGWGHEFNPNWGNYMMKSDTLKDWTKEHIEEIIEGMTSNGGKQIAIKTKAWCSEGTGNDPLSGYGLLNCVNPDEPVRGFDDYYGIVANVTRSGDKYILDLMFIGHDNTDLKPNVDAGLIYNSAKFLQKFRVGTPYVVNIAWRSTIYIDKGNKSFKGWPY